MIKFLLHIFLITLSTFSSLKSNNEIDIALGTKNRMDTFKLVIENLNSADNARNFNLYILDGNVENEVSIFLNKKRWNFKSIKITQDSKIEIIKNNPGRWAIIYDYLIRLGKSPYVTYWSDDILMQTPDIFTKAITRLQKDKDAGIAVFNFKVTPNGSYGVVLNELGLISLNFGIMKREAYIKADGLDHSFKFFRADNDLTNRIYFYAHYKTIINNDCFIKNLNSAWKNPFAQKKHYKDDIELFEKKWNKMVLRNPSIMKKSIANVYPQNTNKINLHP